MTATAAQEVHIHTESTRHQVILLVVEPPHLVPLGAFVVPENDWSSRHLGASLNIEDELPAVQVRNQVLALQSELLVWSSVVFPPAQLST